jgi:hypothetical protein
MKGPAHDRRFALARAAASWEWGNPRPGVNRGMHISDWRACARVATQCLRVNVLTADRARYFCAPVVRVETATAMAVLHSP